MINKYAKIEDGIVINIIMCEDSEITSQNGLHIKVDNTTNIANIGYEYNAEKNKFKAFQPYPSWTLNSDSLIWESPVEIPSEAQLSEFGTVIGYTWNEDSLSWVKVGS